MQNFIYINSRLYSHLFDEGNDGLISVYSFLRFYKEGGIKYYNEGKLSGYNLLRAKTKLSLTTLKRYVPQLVQLGLCHFDRRGQLVLTGTNKINKLYKKGKLKFVPIQIGTLRQTKLFSFRVRVFKMEQQQKNRIDRKDRLNNIIERKKNNRFLSKSQFAQFKAMTDLDWEYYNSNNFEANTVLSNQGYSKLKGSNSGGYWKKQLVSAGIIKTKRNIKLIRKCTKSEYQIIKLLDRSYSYYNGKLYKEFPSLFTTTEFTQKEVKEKQTIKKLDYLDFDFCNFLSLQ